MFGIEASLPLVLLALALAVLFVVEKVQLKRIRKWIEARQASYEQATPVARAIVALLCVPAGFFLVEFPYNTELFEMDLFYVGIGLAINAVLFALIFFIGQRTKTSMMVYLVFCFLIGTASHFVALFKGQPILPSDIAAFQTAAEVSGGYTYVLDDRLLGGFVLIEVFACLLALLPRPTIDRKNMVVNCVLAALIAIGCVVWFNSTDIEGDYHCKVDVWSSLDSYRDQGSLLCFLQRAQQLTPKEPVGYSHEEALMIESGTSTTYQDDLITEDNLAASATALAPSVQPSIVVIMNETFSDLSRYSALGDSYAGPENFKALSSEALLSGDAYVSALGGGTCNSEFEFLTASSAGLLGAGVYPYMLYNLDGVDCLPAYLRSLGYSTCAIHPAAASNWRRDRVYEQLGFDEFYDIASFDGAETRRGMVTDAATYDKVLDILAQDDSPQFIFDVTIANHGGYTTGEIPEDEQVEASVNGESNEEVDEYLSCLTCSDEEFKEFIEELESLDRPVVVCLFGDHQPSFADTLAESSTGVSVTEMDIDQTQQRYVTPYMIWTNDPVLRAVYGVGNTRDLSLNYLASNTLKASGLPLNEYFAFNLLIENELPAINLNGYQDALGKWHWNGEESEASAAYEELAIVQHDNLFDRQ